jgi:glycosyltransferase involved in cell wall biosynthesis
MKEFSIRYSFSQRVFVFLAYLLIALNNTGYSRSHLVKQAMQSEKLLELLKNPVLWSKLETIHPKTEKEIIIISPSFNNKEYYKLHLDSVFMQNYRNYRIIYIDDNSTDNTAQLVERYVKEKKQTHRVKIIRNTKRQGQLANYYYAVQSCDNNAIIIQLDADDFLAHPNVLMLLNKVYESKNVWITYGQSYCLSKQTLGRSILIPDNVIASNSVRIWANTTIGSWPLAHLRTFYAWLFKKIKLQDLCDDAGCFFMESTDRASMIPMIEMAGRNVLFIQDILLLYNDLNPLNTSIDRSHKQVKNALIIKNKKRYKLLKERL